MSLRASILKIFEPKSAEARLADLETKHSAASENLSIARAAFGEASLAVEAGVAGADRQLAKARENVATAEARLADIEAARSVARRAAEEAKGIAEAESAAKRWAIVATKIETMRQLGEEIEGHVAALAEAQKKMGELAEAIRQESPHVGEMGDAFAPPRLEALLRLALFKAGFAWALKTGLTPYQAPNYADELGAALAAATKYAPREGAKAA
ncbi:MAG: hypothetical protein ING19_01455 [Azospirillum sp.]|nr:hypothetical protein [Azospirillum sp.]MCA3264708.1 hypothetical protein [Azospirillum sp.]